ncbi:MAG: hypothetical protein ACXADO_10500, partial [Candidatus Thorarchaeota archaeon]
MGENRWFLAIRQEGSWYIVKFEAGEGAKQKLADYANRHAALSGKDSWISRKREWVNEKGNKQSEIIHRIKPVKRYVENTDDPGKLVLKTNWDELTSQPEWTIEQVGGSLYEQERIPKNEQSIYEIREVPNGYEVTVDGAPVENPWLAERTVEDRKKKAAEKGVEYVPSPWKTGKDGGSGKPRLIDIKTEIENMYGFRTLDAVMEKKTLVDAKQKRGYAPEINKDRPQYIYSDGIIHIIETVEGPENFWASERAGALGVVRRVEGQDLLGEDIVIELMATRKPEGEALAPSAAVKYHNREMTEDLQDEIFDEAGRLQIIAETLSGRIERGKEVNDTGVEVMKLAGYFGPEVLAQVTDVGKKAKGLKWLQKQYDNMVEEVGKRGLPTPREIEDTEVEAIFQKFKTKTTAKRTVQESDMVRKIREDVRDLTTIGKTTMGRVIVSPKTKPEIKEAAERERRAKQAAAPKPQWRRRNRIHREVAEAIEKRQRDREAIEDAPLPAVLQGQMDEIEAQLANPKLSRAKRRALYMRRGRIYQQARQMLPEGTTADTVGDAATRIADAMAKVLTPPQVEVRDVSRIATLSTRLMREDLTQAERRDIIDELVREGVPRPPQELSGVGLGRPEVMPRTPRGVGVTETGEILKEIIPEEGEVVEEFKRPPLEEGTRERSIREFYEDPQNVIKARNFINSQMEMLRDNILKGMTPEEIEQTTGGLTDILTPTEILRAEATFEAQYEFRTQDPSGLFTQEIPTMLGDPAREMAAREARWERYEQSLERTQEQLNRWDIQETGTGVAPEAGGTAYDILKNDGRKFAKALLKILPREDLEGIRVVHGGNPTGEVPVGPLEAPRPGQPDVIQGVETVDVPRETIKESYYDSETNIIHLAGNVKNIKMHEVMHAVIAQKLEGSPALQKKVQKIMDRFRKAVEGTQNMNDPAVALALQDVHEFMSQAVSSPVVQEILK